MNNTIRATKARKMTPRPMSASSSMHKLPIVFELCSLRGFNDEAKGVAVSATVSGRILPVTTNFNVLSTDEEVRHVDTIGVLVAVASVRTVFVMLFDTPAVHNALRRLAYRVTNWALRVQHLQAPYR